MNAKKGSLTRSKIIHAAVHVTTAAGINQLTLEAVAAQAGVSKGGLLYHFPSKEALIEGMIDGYLTEFEARLAALEAADPHPDDGRAWLRAYIHATFDDIPQEGEMAAGLLAAIAVKQELMTTIQSKYDDWQARILASMNDPAQAVIIRLALDGLWASDLMGLAPLNADLRAAVLQKLLEFAKA